MRMGSNALVHENFRRLKSDFCFSNSIVHNNYPLLDIAGEPLNDKHRNAIEQEAQCVLFASAQLADPKLADMNGPLTMPSALLKLPQKRETVVDAPTKSEIEKSATPPTPNAWPSSSKYTNASPACCLSPHPRKREKLKPLLIDKHDKVNSSPKDDTFARLTACDCSRWPPQGERKRLDIKRSLALATDCCRITSFLGLPVPTLYLLPSMQGTSMVFPAPYENFDLLRWKASYYVYAP
jgi:hypothetical protein